MKELLAILGLASALFAPGAYAWFYIDQGTPPPAPPIVVYVPAPAPAPNPAGQPLGR